MPIAGDLVSLTHVVGNVVGFAFTHPYRGIAGLHVLSEHRRKGLARHMVIAMAANAVWQDDPVWLHTVEENVAGVALFKSLGFEEIGMDTLAFWCDWSSVPPIG